MLSIYFISDDDRIESLIEHLQPCFKTRIRKASDFDLGLKEVFENRPSAVFVQSDIGSVSGETVARHMKSLLGSDAPRIVFMGGERAGRKTGDTWYDDWVSLDNASETLRKEFLGIVARYYPEELTNLPAELENTAWQPTESEAETVAAAAAGACLAATVNGECVSPSVDGKRGTPGTVAGLPERAVDDDRLQGETAAPAAEPSRGQGINLETFAAHDSFPETGVTTRGVRVWVLVLLALVAGGGFVVSWQGRGERQASEAKLHASGREEIRAAGVLRTLTGLPSCIKSEWRDPGYSVTHPGWERYVSPDLEFRVYREDSAIKALQVVSRGDTGISAEFPVSLLREFGYSAPLPVGVHEKRESFVVKRVVIKGVAELATYREEGHEPIRAMVLEVLNPS